MVTSTYLQRLLQWEDKVIYANLPIYNEGCFLIDFEIISFQILNNNIPSVLIVGYQDPQYKIHGDFKTLHCCKHQANGKSLADITLSLIIKWE